MELVWCPIAILPRSLLGRKLLVMVVLEGMIHSHVTVMATVTNTCDRHRTAIETLAPALARQPAGIDAVNQLHLVVAIVPCMVNTAPTVIVATMPAVNLVHVAVEMDSVNEVQHLEIDSVGAQVHIVRNSHYRHRVQNG